MPDGREVLLNAARSMPKIYAEHAYPPKLGYRPTQEYFKNTNNQDFVTTNPAYKDPYNNDYRINEQMAPGFPWKAHTPVDVTASTGGASSSVPSNLVINTGTNVKQMLWPSTRGSDFSIKDQATQVRALQKSLEFQGLSGDPSYRASLIDNQWYDHLSLAIFTKLSVEQIKKLSHVDFFSQLLGYLDPTSATVERSYQTAVESFINGFTFVWEGHADQAQGEIRKYLTDWQKILRDSAPSQGGADLAVLNTKLVRALDDRLRRNARTKIESNPLRSLMTSTFMSDYDAWQATSLIAPPGNVGEALRNLLNFVDHLKESYLLKAQNLGYGPYVKSYNRNSADSSNSTFNLAKAKSEGKIISKGASSSEKPTGNSKLPPKPTPKTQAKDKILCTGCGKEHGGGHSECRSKDHPDFNKDTSIPWLQSAAGKAWTAQDPAITSIQFKQSILQPTWTSAKRPADSSSSSHAHKSNPQKKNKKGTSSEICPLSHITSDMLRTWKRANWRPQYLCSTTSPKVSKHDYLLTCNVSYLNRHLSGIECLIDTGAVDRNYVSRELGDQLLRMGAHKEPCDIPSICGCNNSMCIPCQGIIDFDMSFLNELTNKHESISIRATILDSSFDLIIGRRDIFKHDLLFKTYKQIFADLAFGVSTDTGAPTGTSPTGTLDSNLEVETELFDLVYGAHTVPAGFSTKPGTAHSTSTRLLALNKSEVKRQVLTKSQLLNWEDEDDLEIEDDDDWDPFNKNPKTDQGLGYKVFGDPILQASIHALCAEFKDVFSDTLTPEPAMLNPMELQVDSSKWQTNKNRTPFRPVSLAKQIEIQKQVSDMEKQGLIRPSHANHWSQVILAPKPNNKWRFCIDFRNLNDCTQSQGWPLPNIKETLRRIGNARAKTFAVMDLTKGFYQAPLSEEFKKLTAFICFCGLYEWNRVPMGLKGAPSYFQQMLATIVFAGLIHIIMELYIDDIIVHGIDDQQFLARLRQVFERLRRFRVTVNPEKCRFGMDQIEYIGHVVDPTGLSFSQDKKDKVRDFPLPTTAKHVKSFIGLANYFRDHIPNHSTTMVPLQQLILSYEKSKKVMWNPEAIKAFEDMKLAISNCPKLYFLDEDTRRSPVFLHTDASDYGVGAYLFQVIDGKEHPIQFISKAFDKVQLRWATGEKEAYAIFYAIKKLKPLIRDLKFTLRTDHKNLTYINNHASEKVMRWKLELQQYDFDIEHIAGVKNEVADSFSRLVSLQPSREKVEGYERLTVPVAHALGVLSVPQKGKLSPYYIPDSEYKMIRKVHNSLEGHHGVERTLKKLDDTFKERGTWLHRREHVKRFIQSCPCCQKMSHIRVPILTHRFTTSSYTPMERIYIDSIGPLKEDADGNKHIIVIIDGFTRWVELYAVPDVTAEKAAKVALLDWVGRFGTPSQILSDGGTQFVNELWEELTALMGAEKLESFPYSHEENGLVERANKQVMKFLREILFDRQIRYSEWSCYLPLVQRIMNAHPYSSTGASPAELLFGNAVSLNTRILPCTPEQAGLDQKRLSTVTADTIKMQAYLIAKAQDVLINRDNKHLAVPYDDTKKIDHFPIGSYVLLDYNPTALRERGPPHKLMPFKKGPFRVVNSVGSRYTLLDLITNKHEDAHIRQLSPFKYDAATMDPKKIAARDNEEYVVHEILAHKGNKKYKTSLEFKVRWEGYGPEHDTWEPWRNVRLVDKLHAYLYKHGMKSLIPQDCKGVQEPEPSRQAKKRARLEDQASSVTENSSSSTTENSSSSTTESSLRKSTRLRTTATT